jgi:hypothetical protein
MSERTKDAFAYHLLVEDVRDAASDPEELVVREIAYRTDIRAYSDGSTQAGELALPGRTDGAGNRSALLAW